MGSATVGTLVITGVIVAVLAVFLITIGLGLQRLSFTLGTIVVGLRAIREQTRPLGPVLNGIVGDVSAIDEALGGVLEVVGVEAAAAPRAQAVEVEVVEVDALEVAAEVEAAEGPADGPAERADDEYGEEYEYDEEAREPVFGVPTRARRGGSGMAEALARAGGRR